MPPFSPPHFTPSRTRGKRSEMGGRGGASAPRLVEPMQALRIKVTFFENHAERMPSWKDTGTVRR